MEIALNLYISLGIIAIIAVWKSLNPWTQKWEETFNKVLLFAVHTVTFLWLNLFLSTLLFLMLLLIF
jgi:hypothetical protein